MRRRHVRRDADYYFGLWAEAVSCFDPDWSDICERTPNDVPGLVDPLAKAWLAWPGRLSWLAAHPAPTA